MKKLIPIVFLATLLSTQSFASMYTLTYSDGIANTWTVNFDGVNQGNYVDQISNIDFLFNGINLGPIFFGYFNSSTFKWDSFNSLARIGFSPLYNNFIIINSNIFDYDFSFTAGIYSRAGSDYYTQWNIYEETAAFNSSDNPQGYFYTSVILHQSDSAPITHSYHNSEADTLSYNASDIVVTTRVIINQQVPESTILALVTIGVLGIAATRRKRQLYKNYTD